MRIAVIGRGLFGSAAARHLARAGHDVVLVGPEEPVRLADHAGPFASHYDEGRITRRLATHPFWAKVSIASIDRYPEIEAQGGTRVFTRAGAMMLGPADSDFVAAAASVRAGLGIDTLDLDDAGLAQRFPWLAMPPGTRAFFEPDTGHISPRAMVAAQTAAARAAGARLLPAAAIALEEGDAGVTVVTGPERVAADAALLATGGMTGHLSPVPLPLTVLRRTVAFFEVDAAEAARLSAMPSMVLRLDVAGEPYLLPPIRYPDGRILVKLGGDPHDVPLTSPEATGAWFRSGGDGAVRDHLHDLMLRIVPDLAVRSVSMAPCMTTYTPSGLPLIGPLTPRIAVATAGNGAGAKCSDELGRLGAETVLGRPPEGLGLEPSAAPRRTPALHP